MSGFLRGNVGLAVWLGIFGIAAVVLTLSAVQMSSRGYSLKPVWWFAGCLLLIGFPQLLYHSFVAATSTRQSSASPVETAARASGLENPEALLTTAPDGATVRDIPPQAATGVFAKAEQVRHMTMANGDTVMIAKFGSNSEARTSVAEYLKESGLEGGAQPDGSGGFFLPGNDQRSAHVYASDRLLIIHATTSSPTGSANHGPIAANDPMKRVLASRSSKIAAATALLLYTLLVSVFFLKGIAWATRVEAKPVARVLSGNELRERLLALNDIDIPFRIEAPNDGEVIATWKYADAKWVDLARARGMRRIHRIRMTVDEAQRKIRATDFQASYDWSAGAGGAGISWKATTGVVLFQYEHQRVYGLRLDDQGRLTPELSYTYTFDLQEMKAPLIEAITQSGWHWQPVAWQAPPSLRWLTE